MTLPDPDQHDREGGDEGDLHQRPEHEYDGGRDQAASGRQEHATQQGQRDDGVVTPHVDDLDHHDGVAPDQRDDHRVAGRAVQQQKQRETHAAASSWKPSRVASTLVPVTDAIPADTAVNAGP